MEWRARKRSMSIRSCRCCSRNRAVNRLSADESVAKTNDRRLIRTISEVLDGLNQSDWTSVIRDEISKHCSTHYDQGQAIWSSPWQHLPLYQAWRNALATRSEFRSSRRQGLSKTGCRTAPSSPRGIGRSAGKAWGCRTSFGRRSCNAMPWQRLDGAHGRGTSSDKPKRRATEDTDFAGLLAMRLAYEVALSECFALKLDWNSVLRLSPGVWR